MHGCGSGSGLLVNAEVDSMGGVVDGGVGIDIKASPHRAAIEKAQAELRQEYDVREERRRELEFLEKGGNPLDFKFGNAASVSVQSTSLIDHQAEHFVTSEAKGSFALTASPHGDSVESSGRPGVPTICEPNSADNFHGENELHEGERKVKHPTRRNKIVPSEQSSEMDGAQNPKESEDSAIFHSYARRNRSRPNRDAARSSSTDVVQSSVGHGSSLPVRGGSRDVRGSVSETKSQKEHTTPSASIPKSASNGDILPQIESSTTRLNMESNDLQAMEAKENLPKDGPPEDRLEGFTEGKNLLYSQPDQPAEGDSQKICMDIGSEACDHAAGKEQAVSAGPEVAPNSVTKEFDNKTSSVRQNGFSDAKVDENEGQNDIVTTRTMVLDSELSCTQNRPRFGANNDSGLCVTQINEGSDVIPTESILQCEERNTLVCTEKELQKGEIMAVESYTFVSDDRSLMNQIPSCNGSVLKTDEVKCPNFEETKQNNDVMPEVDKVGNSIDGNSGVNRGNIFTGGHQASSDKSVQEVPLTIMSEKNFAPSDPQLCPGSPLKVVDKAHEDSILEEARIIEAKRKRIAELSVGTIQQEYRRKTHWDFVLEEMAWLANDFSQERLWKMTAAAQICHRAALTCRLRVEEHNQARKLKRVSYILAKAVMQFWNSAEVLLNSEDQSSSVKDCNHDSRRLDCSEFSKDKFGEYDKETCNKLESQNPGKTFGGVLRGYAVRFLKSNSTQVPAVQAEAPATPDRITDLGIVNTFWDDNLTEESLFYAVPSGAMETYRVSIESHLAHCEKTGSSMEEEVDTSMHDAAAEIRYHENIYDEEEGETSTYYLPGVYEGSNSTKHDQKKRKVFMKSYSARLYEADLPCGHPAVVSQQHTLMGKRSGNNLQVGSIPTKRMRTAGVVRQRVISPFGGAGTPMPLPAPTKTDASSGDTSSFQDDQSTLHGGFHAQKSMEVESVADFERQLPYDCAETSTKPKKKKKAKHLGSSYDPVWQLDSIVNNEQRDNSRKRVQSHYFDSNGTSDLYAQHAAKKPKIVKQSLDDSFDNLSGSIPSPAASQMSNMSNTNRFMKIINGQKGRKNKSLKVSAVQPGSGSPWSLFEDQALVVLVHDMGPNWELVSDAINSTLQFKCIFRKPQACKDRHKVLMDKGAGDGADSADDSGSSHSYPSTLPGIPKGSARQLFQRLQGPMLEETLKSHFEKIIMIGKKQLYRKNQNDNQDTKQLAAVHNSHFIALSQVCPNNLNGGLLTPLDLCDASASSPEVLPLGYQGSHAGGLPMPNQGAIASILPSTGANSLLASSGMVLGNNCASPSPPLTAPVRDGRYSVPRASLPVDEQQRMQHYNQMLSGRNMQQSNLSLSSALTGSDRRVLPGGSGMGTMPGVNRNLPISRPAFQGMTSSPMLNSGTMLSSSMVGMPSPGNMHSGTGSAQGNSLMRPREASHMMRPGHNPEHQRQMMVPEMQVQVSQGNSPGTPGFNGLSSGLAKQTTSPPVQGYPGHPQQHQMSAQQSHVLNNPHHPHLQGPNQVTGPQQAYAMRLAKERQMQQRLLQQQQQQLAASSSLMPLVQPQSQLPASSSIQTSTQIPPPSSMPPLTPSSPLTPISMQQQQKHNLPHHGLNRNPQASAIGLNNQIGKQRQRQPQQQQQQQQFQQSSRHHPQQRQHTQSPQQAKLMKGMGRGTMIMHQNIPMDPSQLNGLSVPSGNQSVEKGEQITHLVQGQGLYPGTGLSSTQPSKPLVPQSSNHSQQQPKVFSGSNPPSKQLQQIPSHSDNSAQGQAHPVSSAHGLGASHQPITSPTMVSNQQHLQPQSHQKQFSQSQQTVQRLPQLNRQLPSGLPAKSQNDQGQPVNNVPQLASGTTALPQACSESVSAVPAVSSAVNSQWKQSEPLYESGLANPVMHVASTGSESALPGSQGLGSRQVSGGLAQHSHNSASHWQQQPHHSKIPQASQQQFQPQGQQLQEQDRSSRLAVQQQSQQQAHLQTAPGGVYARPTNSKTD